jgi:Domain of unknown function (DUF4111)/Nucleotidyltransferase domain
VKAARDRLNGLVRDLQRVLGDALVGVYLHGSLALGCFNPALSDVDLLVVTKAPLSPGERDALAPLLVAGGRIEGSFLVEASLTPWRHPAPYDLHFTWPARLVGPGEDHDLAAHITVTRHAGIALLGPPPSDVFPGVPWHDYEDSLRRDLAWSGKHGTELYAVLSPARIWATLTERAVHSKSSGAAWALEHAPAEFRPLLERALDAYRTHDETPAFDPEEIRRFAEFVMDQLRTVG